MNRKGFTLVELLAVIIILALLAVIASTSVTKVVDDSKNDLATAQIKLIEDAAKTLGAENMNALPEGNSCIYLTLKDLKIYGLIDSDIRNPKTEKKLSNDLKIKITSKISNYNTQVLNYEVDPDSVEGCEKYYSRICTLVEGKSKQIGSKYQCKVKEKMEEGFEDGYYFYVLSTEEDGTYNLILDRNVYYDATSGKSGLTDEEHLGLVEWINQSDYETVSDNNWDDLLDNNKYGPITAMNYLNNATITWTNVPNMDITYNDEEENFEDFPITGKARLPYRTEIIELDGVNGSNIYLFQYLNEHVDEFGNSIIIPIPGIFGYWLFDSFSGEPNMAFALDCDGSTYDMYIDSEDTYGVRPVINVRL